MFFELKKKGLTIFPAIFLFSQSIFAFYTPSTKSAEKKSEENNFVQLVENSNKEENELFKANFEKDFYLIGPGDVLELNLFDADEFSGSLNVLNDGYVQFPLIGMQYLKDLTLDQAKKLVQEKYREQLLRPELHLKVLIPRPIRVSLIGEIEKPGIYSLTSNNTSLIEGSNQITNDGLPTIIDAIQKAGGITQDANLRNLSLIRRLPGGNAQYKQANINLLEIVLEGDQFQNLFLFDGDIIKLHKAEKISKDIKKISQTNISPQKISINIVGQVNSPGPREVKANTPLVQAVYMAGGPVDWKSNMGNVELLRINKNGSASRRKFKIKLDQDISSDLNPPLMNEDIIYVRSNTINRISTGLGAVTQPLTPIINSFAFFKLLE